MQRYNAPDLKDCEKEPIHIIGKIQSYGYLLVIDPEGLVIEQVSANIEDLLGTPAEEMTGLSIDDFFPFSFLEYFNQMLNREKAEEQHSLSFELNKKNYILSVHNSEGWWVLEIEPDQKDRNTSYHHYTDLVENLVYDIDKPRGLQELCQYVIERMRPILGFDRMMVYQFDEDKHGEVVAETAEDKDQKYLGLKFPAGDIPAQARKLYLQNTVRGIWEVDDSPVAILPEIRQSDDRPLNLSQSFLRSVSPIHVEYLKNMGLKASFSISLVVKNRLWGMILCHHSTQPVRLNIHQRRACSFIGKVLSQKIASELEEERMRAFRSRLGMLRKLVSSLVSSGDLHQVLSANQEAMLNAFGAMGYALNYAEYQSTSSAALNEECTAKILNLLRKRNEHIFHTHTLKESFPEVDFPKNYPAGMLAIKLSDVLNEYLLIFRHEQVQEIDWAGKPAAENDDLHLGPRQSFLKWTEETSNQSARWQAEDLMLAEEMRMQLIENILSMANRPHVNIDHLQMRLAERNRELEERNAHLQNELEHLRKMEARYALNQEVSAERSRMRPVPGTRKLT